MDVDPEPVPRAVPEAIRQPVAFQRRPGRAVDVAREHPGRRRGQGRRLRLAHRPMQPAGLAGRRPDRHRARDVDAIALVDPSEVEDDEIAAGQPALGRMRVRKRPVRTGSHDGVEGGTLEACLLDQPLHVSRHLDLGTAAPRARAGRTDDGGEHPARLPQRLGLV